MRKKKWKENITWNLKQTQMKKIINYKMIDLNEGNK